MSPQHSSRPDGPTDSPEDKCSDVDKAMQGDHTRDDEAGLAADKIKRVEDLFDLVRNCDGNLECWLLLGAGCSFPQVPLATGFVKIIEKKYPNHFAQAAEPKGYAQCMHVLPLEFRRQIIRDSINKARILEGYIAIASLIKAGFIHKVLTVNFDPLLLKACALVGKVPAVYDLAASLYAADADAGFRPTLATPAIVHLHGQNEGIVLINGPEEVEKMSERLRWLFDDAGKHLWIVAGYSGEQDPVFGRLAKTPRFDASLFWMRHDGLLPCPAVVKMIKDRPGAAVVFNQPCDDVFVRIAQKMGCYPPAVFSKPLEHIEDQLKTQLSDSCKGVIAGTIRYIERAREVIRNDASMKALEVQSLAQAGDFDKAFAAFKQLENPAEEPELLGLVAGAAGSVDALRQLLSYAEHVGIQSAIVEAVAERGVVMVRDDPDGVLRLLGTLPSCETLTWLQTLWLDHTQVTDAGLVHLKGLPGLQGLSLSGTKVTDAGLVHLEGLAGLQWLLLHGTRVTDVGLAELRQALRGCDIYGP